MTKSMIWDWVAIAMAVIAMILARSARRRAERAMETLSAARSSARSACATKDSTKAVDSANKELVLAKGCGPTKRGRSAFDEFAKSRAAIRVAKSAQTPNDESFFISPTDTQKE